MCVCVCEGGGGGCSAVGYCHWRPEFHCVAVAERLYAASRGTGLHLTVADVVHLLCIALKCSVLDRGGQNHEIYVVGKAL